MPDQPAKRNIGRPRKDGLPAGSREAQAADAVKKLEQAKKAVIAAEPPKPASPPVHFPAPENTQGERNAVLFPGCLTCHPNGWPKGWTGYACEHGIWSRPWVP